VPAPSLTAAIKHHAHRLGFALAGVCPATPLAGADRLREWLASGYAGQMHYLPEREEAYAHPRSVLDGVRSIVVLAMNYRTAEPAQVGPGQGRVSRYAWGDADYHDVIHDRLRPLCDFVHEHSPSAKVRGVVDTAPLMERELAQTAGLGWVGKNTLLLNKKLGSWFFLAALLTDLELEYDSPHEQDHCGTCRACLDACPTNAFPQPYVLDATRCISYLTIELRDHIPSELRAGVGQWLFGCDICQDVCPWNHRAPQSDEAAFTPLPDRNPIELAGLFALDDDAFRERFRHTPLWRARRRGILRNAAIVLGNRPDMRCLDALIGGLVDSEPLVRAACAWALARYDNDRAREALGHRLPDENDPEVRSEIERALVAARSPDRAPVVARSPDRAAGQ
jgi:epoxyqueuosine reductase